MIFICFLDGKLVPFAPLSSSTSTTTTTTTKKSGSKSGAIRMTYSISSFAILLCLIYS